jgi:hypothetical protein
MMDVDSDEEIDLTNDEVVDELALRQDQIPWTFEHVERPGKMPLTYV